MGKTTFCSRGICSCQSQTTLWRLRDWLTEACSSHAVFTLVLANSGYRDAANSWTRIQLDSASVCLFDLHSTHTCLPWCMMTHFTCVISFVLGSPSKWIGLSIFCVLCLCDYIWVRRGEALKWRSQSKGKLKGKSTQRLYFYCALSILHHDDVAGDTVLLESPIFWLLYLWHAKHFGTASTMEVKIKHLN